MALEPENTMRSFRRAESMGVDAVELDVWLSRDGRLVVMHDPTLDRTTNGAGDIADASWNTIQALDAGQGEHVPELEAICREIRQTGLQIEIKTPGATESVMSLLRTVCPDRRDITISTFSVECAQAVLAGRRDDAEWRVGLICGANERDKLEENVDLGMDQLMVNWALSDLDAAEQFRKKKCATIWQCTTSDDVLRAMDEGWAGTTLDDPRIGLALLAERAGVTLSESENA
ncbi:glycerophosphodiester phosphodiesterase [Spelaeicoccus albus]|nr:glycerophosphodiester phosphodiesterase family protein [Spelaeicoccus albus]